MLLGRPWYDAALLTGIMLVFVLEAVRIRRETNLGWAMATKNLWLAAVFGFAVFFNPPSSVAANLSPIATILRIGLALSLTWEVYELQVKHHWNILRT